MIQREFFESYYYQTLIAIILFVSINSVLFFTIYKGKLLSINKLKKVAYFFNGLFFLTALLLYMLYRPQNIDQRIAFLPTTIQVSEIDSAYSFAFVEQIEHNLRNIFQQNTIVHSVWWTYASITDKKKERIAEVTHNLPNTTIIRSNLTEEDGRFVFEITSDLFSKRYAFLKLDDFPALSEKIIKQFCIALDIPKPLKIVPYFDLEYTKAKQLFLNGEYDQIVSNYAKETQINKHLQLLLSKSYLNIGLKKREKQNLANPFERERIPNEITKAKNIIYFLFNKNRTDLDIYPPLIRLFLFDKDYEEAEDLIKGFLTDFGEQNKLRKSHPEVYFYYSFLHNSRFQADGFKLENDLLKEALSINPFYTKAFLQLTSAIFSETFTRIVEKNEAVFLHEEYLKLNPYTTEVELQLAQYYILRSKYAQAYNVFNKYINLKNKNSNSYYDMGVFFYRFSMNISEKKPSELNGKLYTKDDALQVSKSYFLKAINIDNHLDSHLYLGKIFYEERNYETAISHYQYRVKHRETDNDPFFKQAAKGLRRIFENDTTLFKKYIYESGYLK